MANWLKSAAMLASATCVLGALASTAQAETLKVTSCLAKNHDAIETYFQAFHDPLNAKKAGLTLRYLGGPEATPRQKQAPALKRGLIDVIICPTPYYGGLLNEARLPGMHRKSLAEMRANGAFDMLQEAWGKGLNAHIVAWPAFNSSTFFIYTVNEPKISEKTGLDLDGVKMRSTGFYNAFFKAMGATPIVISPGDVYAALERGVVEGMAWPHGSVSKYGWQKFLRYRISPNFFGSTYMVLVNLDKYNGLSAEHRKLLEDQGRSYETESDAIFAAKAKLDDAKLEKAGVQTVELQGAARKAYLGTIYRSKWAEVDKLKYIVDYKVLKDKMYGTDE